METDLSIDVQLTKDLVPVIYHDWTVTESGFDIPLNAITSEQFLNLRPSGHIKEYHTGVSDGVYGEVLSTSPRASANESIPDHSHLITTASSPSKRMNRSHSVGSIDDSPAGGRFSRRQELTRTNKLGKLKGNGPESIQAPFTTLAEALKVNLKRQYQLFMCSHSEQIIRKFPSRPDAILKSNTRWWMKPRATSCTSSKS